MPELPEVETVRRGLARLLLGRVVRRVTVFDSPKSFPNAPEQVEHFLYGASVVAVRRRAKVLIIDLSTNYSLVIHLKMTGQLIFRTISFASSLATHSPRSTLFSESAPGTSIERSAEISLGSISQSPQRSVARSEALPSDMQSFAGGHPNDSLIGELPDRSTRVLLEFTDGSHLYFNDQRKFGWIKLMPTAEVEQLPFFQKVGPEPLEETTTAAEFVQRIRRRTGSMVKPAILDQSVIAGVGNIYADEALWAANIHPETRVRDLSDVQLKVLFTEIVHILQLSIDKGGSTDKNYVDAEGRKGSYLQFARVFRREGQSCYRHPDEVITKVKVAGRGTHICLVCQPKGEL
ncbi:MAG TPA: DNA-formamidopyrimidine glycosylase family protein [Candidatus Saccharibacteria bacterium]|mgnify:CR=1 FL=1|nr:DNA-formamidopyrimidine glycosylase family protein [Candidatus Saccharibacteria bacterium]HMR37981.1 DNA-formamidopyrimidine glycosylase family protein [Candidatus Saccharibacteria bacterium]